MVATRTITLDEGTNEALAQIARTRGVTVESLLEQLARQAALYEVEYVRGVNEGIADADAKRLVTADQVHASVRDALKSELLDAE